jgi:competence protein ComEC
VYAGDPPQWADAFTAKEWLAADGDDRLPNDKSLADGFRCDALGCVAALPDGKLVSQVSLPDAFAEDCTRAAVVVTSREMPGDCPALAIDRKVWRASCAIALRRSGESFAIEPAPARWPGAALGAGLTGGRAGRSSRAAAAARGHAKAGGSGSGGLNAAG